MLFYAVRSALEAIRRDQAGGLGQDKTLDHVAMN
jgi:hypothetical protein